MLISSYNDDLAFLNGFFLLLFILLNDVRFRVSVVSCFRISRFSNACALVFSALYWGFMVWIWMGGILLVLMTIFACCLGL